MKVSVSKFPEIITAWADKELIPKSSPIQIAMIVFALKTFQTKIIAYASLAADEKGIVDLDEFTANAREALRKAGGQIVVPVLNYGFDEKDLDSIHDVAKSFGVPNGS